MGERVAERRVRVRGLRARRRVGCRTRAGLPALDHAFEREHDRGSAPADHWPSRVGYIGAGGGGGGCGCVGVGLWLCLLFCFVWSVWFWFVVFVSLCLL